MDIAKRVVSTTPSRAAGATRASGDERERREISSFDLSLLERAFFPFLSLSFQVEARADRVSFKSDETKMYGRYN